MNTDFPSDTDNHDPIFSARAKAPNPVALTREDLAAMLAAYRAESRSPRQWRGVATGIGGMFASATLITLGENLHWPSGLLPVFFVGGWSVLLVSLFGVARRERQFRARYQVECPACGEGLLEGRSVKRDIARAELAVTNGNCPSCGARLLEL